MTFGFVILATCLVFYGVHVLAEEWEALNDPPPEEDDEWRE